MNAMTKKILLPVDGSENSQKAVKKCLEIAKPIGAAVTALFVVDSSAYLSLPETFMWENVRGAIEEEGKEALEGVKKTFKDSGVKLKTELKEGSPAKDIVETAEEEKIDLIIMGTAGRKGLDRFFLGSVSEKVLRSAHCAVMVVK